MNSKIFSKHFFWIIIGIPLLSYIILKPSFNLSLFGDDWEQLYFMWLEFESRHSFQWHDIRSYLGPYNFSYSYLGIINNFFGLNSAAYFYASYFFRVLSVISVYFLVNFLTKDKLAAFLSTLLLIFSASGLETTNWVFNMNTYMAIFLFNLSVIFYLKFRLKTIWNSSLFFFILFFASSLIVASTRMHGAAPFIILIDLILIFLFENGKATLISYSRLVIPIAILLTLMHFGVFGHVGSGGFTERLKLGTDVASSLLSKGQYLFVFYLPGIIGHIALPDYLAITFGTSIGLIMAMAFYTVLLALSVLIITNSKNLFVTQRKLSRMSFFGVTFFWAILVFAVYKLNPIISQNQYFSIFVGGETLFLMFWLFLVLRTSYPLFSFASMFSLLWLILFTLIYWLFSPAVFSETTSRYLTMGGVGSAIFFGVFLSFLFKNSKPSLKALPVIFVLILLFVNFLAGKQYWTFMEASRNSKLAISIWNSLTESITDLDKENPTVFFFTAGNPNIFYWNVDFGFPSHMGLTYRIPDLNDTPVSVTDYPTLLEYAKNGSPLKKIHGRPIKDIPLDHIYAYHLTQDRLISQTDLIRKKLKEDLEKIILEPKVGY